MFQIDHLTFHLSIHVPGSSMAVPVVTSSTSGARLIVEIKHMSTLPQDVEIDIDVANGLVAVLDLVPREVLNIPDTNGSTTPYVTEFDLVRSSNPTRGTETISCRTIRYRDNGDPGWSAYDAPKSGHTVLVTAG